MTLIMGNFVSSYSKRSKRTNCHLPARKFYKKFDAVHSPKFLVAIMGAIIISLFAYS